MFFDIFQPHLYKLLFDETKFVEAHIRPSSGPPVDMPELRQTFD